MGKIILGYWDCKQCGTSKISGELRDCPTCGKPRPDGTRFYVSDVRNPTYVSTETEKEVRKRGRDWTCEYCGSMNSGLVTVCPGCGAERTISQQDEKPTEQHIQLVEEDTRSEAPEQSAVAPTQPSRFSKGKLRTFAVSTAVIAGITALITALVFLLAPKDVELQITDMSWQYDIEVEKLTAVNESDWVLPSEGRLQFTQQEIHHYEKVLDHYDTEWYDVVDGYDEVVVGYEDLGNGYLEEITRQEPRYKQESRKVPVYKDEPVYRTKYYYEIDKWLYHRSVSTSAHDKNPYWGEVILQSLEREGSRTQTYRIYGIDAENKKCEYKVDHSVWFDCEVNDVVKGKADIFGNFTLKDEINALLNNPMFLPIVAALAMGNVIGIVITEYICK